MIDLPGHRRDTIPLTLTTSALTQTTNGSATLFVYGTAPAPAVRLLTVKIAVGNAVKWAPIGADD